jgi:hypothetical protein
LVRFVYTAVNPNIGILQSIRIAAYLVIGRGKTSLQ